MMSVNSSFIRRLIFSILVIAVPGGFVSDFISGTTSTGTDDEEMVLSFSHHAAGQAYINALYNNSTTYLPLSELFTLLGIHIAKDRTEQIIQGSWFDTKWSLNMSTMKLSAGRESSILAQEDYRLGDMDIYLTPEVFEKIFGLHFSVNISSLSLNLESDKILPAEERKMHELQRKDLEEAGNTRPDSPLLYNRERKFLGMGLADYYVSMNDDNGSLSADYNITGGIEFLGGDLQGTVYGSVMPAGSEVRTGNICWKYVLSENPYLTSIRAGEMGTTGLLGQRIVGAAVSNDPVEPRKVYNTYSIDGHTIPDSEVELYINNQLTGFKKADELGYYRFSFSLVYGTLRITIRIYTPSGEIINEERNLQIPYTFLPKGVVSYNIQGGALDDGITDLSLKRYSMHGDVAVGITNTVTAKAGSDFFSTGEKPLNYASISARIAGKYLLDLDAAPGAFYRATGSVTYPTGMAIDLSATRFEDDSLYNPRHARQMTSAGLYLPFRISNIYSGLRFAGEEYLLRGSKYTGYRIDFTSRIRQISLRADYRERLTSMDEQLSIGSKLASASITYSIPGSSAVPGVFRNLFLRAQTQYDVNVNRFRIAGIQLSKSVSRTGRLTLSADHDLGNRSTFVQAGLYLDFRKVRSVSRYQSGSGAYSFQHVFSGSVSHDGETGRMVLSNREQAGRSAVSVLMFIDSNSNGKFDHGEEKVPVRGFRINESALFETGSDSILRITQLQSYWRYKASIIQSALPDPSLTPAVSDFSFITDPNRFKLIEIPLYRTGTIDGKITIRREAGSNGLGGVRLIIRQKNGTNETIIRSFSDGSFYAMQLMPGSYSIEVDSLQLGFLDAVSSPGKREFEIRPTPDGDYVADLDFELSITGKTMDAGSKAKTAGEPATQPSAGTPGQQEDIKTYRIQAGAFRDPRNARQLVDDLKTLTGYEAEIKEEDALFKVSIGKLFTKEQGSELVALLNSTGIKAFIVLQE